MGETKLVTGIFKSRLAAETAIEAVMRHGFNRDQVSVLMSDATKTKEFALQTKTQAAEGAGIGGALGGVVGATLAALVAVGTSIALPGIGLVIAGPIAAALAGAGAGGVTGGVIGALIGAGIPEHRAHVYEAGIRGGGILLGVEVNAPKDIENVEKLFTDLGGEHVRQE